MRKSLEWSPAIIKSMKKKKNQFKSKLRKVLFIILDAEDDHIEVSQMKQCFLKLLKISPLCCSSLFLPSLHVI